MSSLISMPSPNPIVKKDRDLFYSAVIWLLTVLLCYFFTAVTTFQLRHPWATDTERSLYLVEALKFERVTIEEARRGY